MLVKEVQVPLPLHVLIHEVLKHLVVTAVTIVLIYIRLV